MLKVLKFVQGAVAKKDFVPALTHFAIENGTVRGYNGMVALCSPIPFHIDCKPRADTLVRAIANCSETVQMHMTPSNRLSIKSGKFKAFVECIEGDTPHVEPEGEFHNVDGSVLLDAIKRLLPFVGDDASRPWSNGILFNGVSAFATNNIVLVEYWIGGSFPHAINIPRAALKEMVRIGEAPLQVQLSDNSVSFHYADGRWLRTQLFSSDWPDLAKVLNQEHGPTTEIPQVLFDGIRTLKPFTDKLGRVYFSEGVASTVETADAEGAAFESEDLPGKGIYSVSMLELLEGVAVRADWTGYPGPCIFYGADRLRGAIIGIRK